MTFIYFTAGTHPKNFPHPRSSRPSDSERVKARELILRGKSRGGRLKTGTEHKNRMSSMSYICALRSSNIQKVGAEKIQSNLLSRKKKKSEIKLHEKKPE